LRHRKAWFLSFSLIPSPEAKPKINFFSQAYPR
jgi:hypothetical protein